MIRLTGAMKGLFQISKVRIIEAISKIGVPVGIRVMAMNHSFEEKRNSSLPEQGVIRMVWVVRVTGKEKAT